MNKMIIFLTIALLSMASNLYAEGDLIVDGQEFIGTTSVNSNTNGKLHIHDSNTSTAWIQISTDEDDDSNDVVSMLGGVLFGVSDFGVSNLNPAHSRATQMWTSLPIWFIPAGDYYKAVVIDTSGYVGFGVASPGHPIEMASGAYVTSTGVWSNASSREYKENIQILSAEKAREALKGLNPVEFNYKVDKEEKYVGFIAEDVPDLVATKDRKGLSPMDVVAVLTSVVKEQQNIAEKQQKTISELSEKVAELEREVKLKSSLAMSGSALH